MVRKVKSPVKVKGIVKLPSRREAFVASKRGPKLTIAQQDHVLMLLSQGYKPTRVCELLATEQGVAISSGAIRGYLKTHKDEIAQRREQWNSEIESVPLRYRRTRLEELVRLYSLTLREFYRLPCKSCNGLGSKAGSFCMSCKGLGWSLPRDAVAYEIGENVESDALRLSQAPPPPNFDAAAWDRAMSCLKEIREEVGDSVDKKRRDNVEEAETLARTAAMQSLKQRIDSLTSTEFIGLLRDMGQRREKERVD